MDALELSRSDLITEGALARVLQFGLTDDELFDLTRQLASQTPRGRKYVGFCLACSEPLTPSQDEPKPCNDSGLLPEITSVETEGTYVVITKSYDDRTLNIVGVQNINDRPGRYRILNSNDETTLWEGTLP